MPFDLETDSFLLLTLRVFWVEVCGDVDLKLVFVSIFLGLDIIVVSEVSSNVLKGKVGLHEAGNLVTLAQLEGRLVGVQVLLLGRAVSGRSMVLTGLSLKAFLELRLGLELGLESLVFHLSPPFVEFLDEILMRNSFGGGEPLRREDLSN